MFLLHLVLFPQLNTFNHTCKTRGGDTAPQTTCWISPAQHHQVKLQYTTSSQTFSHPHTQASSGSDLLVEEWFVAVAEMILRTSLSNKDPVWYVMSLVIVWLQSQKCLDSPKILLAKQANSMTAGAGVTGSTWATGSWWPEAKADVWWDTTGKRHCRQSRISSPVGSSRWTRGTESRQAGFRYKADRAVQSKNTNPTIQTIHLTMNMTARDSVVCKTQAHIHIFFCACCPCRCRPRRPDGLGVAVPGRGAEHQPHPRGANAQAEPGEVVQHRGAAGRGWLSGPVSREGGCPEVPAHTHEHCKCCWLVHITWVCHYSTFSEN